jgi:hypothetical protein
MVKITYPSATVETDAAGPDSVRGSRHAIKENPANECEHDGLLGRMRMKLVSVVDPTHRVEIHGYRIEFDRVNVRSMEYAYIRKCDKGGQNPPTRHRSRDSQGDVHCVPND